MDIKSEFRLATVKRRRQKFLIVLRIKWIRKETTRVTQDKDEPAWTMSQGILEIKATFNTCLLTGSIEKTFQPSRAYSG